MGYLMLKQKQSNKIYVRSVNDLGGNELNSYTNCYVSNVRSGRHQFKINSVTNGANIKHRYGPKHLRDMMLKERVQINNVQNGSSIEGCYGMKVGEILRSKVLT